MWEWGCRNIGGEFCLYLQEAGGGGEYFTFSNNFNLFPLLIIDHSLFL